MARKPLASTVAANVLAFGTGALNIDACRVGTGIRMNPPAANGRGGTVALGGGWNDDAVSTTAAGRWPSNVVLVHSEKCVPVGTRKVRGSRIDKPAEATPDARVAYGAMGAPRSARGHGDEDGMETVEAWECVEGCPVAEMDAQSGVLSSWMAGSNRVIETTNDVYGKFGSQPVGPQNQYGDSGGASRFFPTFRYQAKADGSERPSYIGPVCFSDAGCSQVTDDMHPSAWPEWARDPKGVCPECGTPCGPIMHPTVKPRALLDWLCRLVTPPGGVILDPFAGTGTTGEAAILGGFRVILIDKVGAHIPLIEQRVRKYDDPHAMAAARRGEKVPTRMKSPSVRSDGDGHDLLAAYAALSDTGVGGQV